MYEYNEMIPAVEMEQGCGGSVCMKFLIIILLIQNKICKHDFCIQNFKIHRFCIQLRFFIQKSCLQTVNSRWK